MAIVGGAGPVSLVLLRVGMGSKQWFVIECIGTTLLVGPPVGFVVIYSPDLAADAMAGRWAYFSGIIPAALALSYFAGPLALMLLVASWLRVRYRVQFARFFFHMSSPRPNHTL